jgi:hypothetical protein
MQEIYKNLLKGPANAFVCVNVILLHSNHQHVSARHVAETCGTYQTVGYFLICAVSAGFCERTEIS